MRDYGSDLRLDICGVCMCGEAEKVISCGAMCGVDDKVMLNAKCVNENVMRCC